MECSWVETIRRTQTAVEMAHKYAKMHAKEEVKLPDRFKRHAALFSDEEAKKFPPSQPHDHKIELTEDAPAQFNMRMYPLLAKEQEAEDKFLNENLEKGYIVPSNPPYGFATFQVPKKDSNEKCYIIDYRRLNKVTKHDVTPLPNLAQCIEDLQSMELFSKFDIHWGYNNIRICKEDQWKAAFKMCRGLFEPRVMFFGMSNSLAAFQCFMNYILEPWYKKHGYKKGKNYMDDIGITTKLLEWALHKEMIDDLFDILAEHGLHLKLSKLVFMQRQMDFLGIHINKDGVTIDPAKIAGITEWPEEITMVKGVHAILGVCGYHQMFIPRFSFIAAPLFRLTCKDIPFVWDKDCRQAVQNLKKAVTTASVLVQPDPSRQFELEVDASAIATGAILYQRDPPVMLPSGKIKPGPCRPVGYHSQKFTATKMNYPIYDCKFLAIIHNLRNWNHLLKGTTIPVLVYMDHTNLCYYWEPRKIGPRVAGYLPECEQYNILLEYKLGTTNRADELSHQEDHDTGSNLINEDVTVWPDHYFCKQHMKIRVFDMDSMHDSLENQCKQVQYKAQDTLKCWAAAHNLTTLDGTHWSKGTTLVVVEDNTLKRGVTSLFHDSTTASHPKISKTLQLLQQYYWWPNQKQYITEYIRGCATCQMTKVNTHPTHPPLYPITLAENARPFETIAMDFIMKLLPLGGFNTILTITDTDCSKVSIFIPCNETIDSEEVATLHLTNVLPHYGLLKKIISDCNPHFTSRFGQALCQTLDIRQNISTAYHLQTDGASKRTNQSLKQYLWLYCSTKQNSWHTYSHSKNCPNVLLFWKDRLGINQINYVIL